MGSKRRLNSSDEESSVPLARRRRTSQRATAAINYAESSGEEKQVTNRLVTTTNDSEEEAEVVGTSGINAALSDSDGGGFIIAPATSTSSKGTKKKRQSRSNTVTPSTAKSTRRSSEQVTPATSEEDELNLLDQPMSSKQGKLLADAVAKSRSKTRVIRLDSDDDDDYDEDFVVGDDDDDDDDVDVVQEKYELKLEDLNSENEDLLDPVPDTKSTKKPRKPRKPKTTKPKVPRHEQYHDRVVKSMAEFHPETVGVFDTLQNTPRIAVEKVEQPEDISVKLLPFQLEGINWLRKQEQTIYAGGILADEMGMGKTIQTVSLMLTDDDRVGPNLVVAPTVAMMQWKNEISEYVGDKLKIYLYYGNNRSADAKELSKYDVILTTYAVCESVYRKQVSGFKRKSGVVKEQSVLHSMFFHRIVLDEAHNIKDRTSNTARAVSTIQSAYKLCLSGTPLQNRVGEIYSLIRFLKVEPFCNYYCTKCECSDSEWRFSDYRSCDNCGHRAMDHPNFFNHSILKFIQREYSSVTASDAMKNLRLLLSQVMLRRTKLERADDLGLPPRIVQVRRDYFNEEERDFYSSIYSDSARQFTSYVNEGVVLNNYANIFTLITRMRQVADHPDLVLRRRQDKADARTAFVCRLCDDEAEDAIKSKCHHMFCRLCIREYVEGWTGNEKDLECPVCHIRLSIDLEAAPLAVDQDAVNKASVVNRIDMSTQWRSSTKIEALVEELFKLRSDRQTIKSIVFSQFTSMLDLVEWRLNKAGFQCVKLQGSMSPAQRDGIIRHFMETPSVEIFLVSLKAGGVALNLCEASQVFLLDPWWNPSVEWQSGDRVHRIGQHRPVQITRFAIEDSIESRIIELQEKKANMINATIGNDDSSMNRLTPADMQFLFTN